MGTIYIEGKFKSDCVLQHNSGLGSNSEVLKELILNNSQKITTNTLDILALESKAEELEDSVDDFNKSLTQLDLLIDDLLEEMSNVSKLQWLDVNNNN